MAPRNPIQPQIVTVEHNARTLRTAIDRLNGVLKEVETFDVNSVGVRKSGPLDALNASIARAIEKAFGENTSDANRFGRAARNYGVNAIIMGRQMSDREYRDNVTSDLAHSIPLLREAIRALEEDLADVDDQSHVEEIVGRTKEPTNKVFIVHGHDDAAKEQVARFLERVGIVPIILHEQANLGNTIIEKIEANSGVDFAVVLLTPDDIGGKRAEGEELKPRARQNVLLELGYFIGKLGRSKVTAFRKGDVEIPSDYLGVVWEPFDQGWKIALGRELIASGFNVDWNTIMAN